MSKKVKDTISKWGGIAAVVAVALSPVAASAAVDTKSTTINATVAATISMTTSGTVAIAVTPTSGGAMSSNSDTVTVATNNSAGYTLTFSNNDTTLNLVSGANTVTPDPGTQGSPTASLTNNRWGYRVASVGGFGAGGAAETNIASSVYSWAGVPSSAAPNTLKTTGTTATADVTTVWYGVKVDTTKPSGVYTDSVTYTATTN